MKALTSCLLILTSFAPLNAQPFDQSYAYELFRYLYRWHMDDAILGDTLVEMGDVAVYYRSFEPKQRDDSDLSDYLELWIPFAKLEVTLKRSDYKIPKLDVEISDQHYKVLSAQHYKSADFDPSQFQKIVYAHDALFDYLDKTRNDAAFPEESTRERISQEATRILKERGLYDPAVMNEALQFGYAAPISIASNELWFYWVNGRKFIRFNADISHEHPSFWKLADARVEVIDVDTQVIVSPHEKSPHGHFTKDYIGRVLFNCVVHGQHLVIPRDEGASAD
ncbi:MAG: hypothetical protein ACPGJU_04575 [Coraliomargarita sp.]